MPVLTPHPPQMDTFFDLTGSRVPVGSGRSGPFVNTGSYADALRNQGIFGNMGESWRGGLAGGHCPPVVGVTVPPRWLHPARLSPHCSVPPGKINTEEIQRTVQKIMEQYMATLKNPR